MKGLVCVCESEYKLCSFHSINIVALKGVEDRAFSLLRALGMVLGCWGIPRCLWLVIFLRYLVAQTLCLFAFS